MIELLAGITVVGFLAIATNGALTAPRPNLDLQSTAHSIGNLIKQTQREAMTRGVRTVIEIEPTSGDVVSFADVNGKSSPTSSAYDRYLVFDPDPALHSARQTDYEIARVHLPEGIRFATPNDFAAIETVEGLTQIKRSSRRALVISSRGTVLDAGSFRIMDTSGRNILEAALLDMTAKVTVRKYLRAEDAPTGQAGFFADSPQPTESMWTWY